MGNATSFPHHTFDNDTPTGAYQLIGADEAAPVIDSQQVNLDAVATTLRDADVKAIVLVHGTFAGDDVIGVVREVSRFLPGLANKLNQVGKRWFDDLVGDVGNFTSEYAKQFEQWINRGASDPITVHRFHWSGENHHIGRADGAMRLLTELPKLAQPDQRVLVMAHSHGGNLAALLSHLIGCDPVQRDHFFERTQLHYRDPLRQRVDLPDWLAARELLTAPLPKLDVATFGTPLRYRWNASGCPNVLHFVQHRCMSDDPTVAMLPRSIDDVLQAAAGDYVQHLGIAGTDFLPSLFAIRDWRVERRMRQLLEPRTRRRQLWRNLKTGRRVSADGMTLLVDYPDDGQGTHRKLCGHGLYTSQNWLPFHLTRIAGHFYQDGSSSLGL